MRPFFTLHRAHATLLALTLLISPWIGACQKKIQEPNRPRLVLLIVVDQLRTDFIQRWEHRLRPRGLRYLLREGVFFTDARYLQANTATGPGHATLVTGAGPSTHGIIGNRWFDRRSRRVRYVVEDPRYQVLGQERIEGEGTSPRNLLSTTISDELVMARPGRSRAFSASMKDRSAILLAGHLGKAYW